MKTLKQYMERNHLNQTQLGEQLGVDRHVMSKWLTGERMPTNESLQKIAALTGSGILETLREWGAIK